MRVGLPRGFWKTIGLDICTVLAAANLGYTYSLYFEDKRTFGILCASAVAYALLSLFQAFFMANIGRRVFVMLLEILGLIAFFFAMPFDALVIVIFATFIFFLWGYLAARAELRNGLEVRFFRTARAHATKFMTGILLALVLLYAPHFTPDKPFMSEEGFGAFMGSISSLTQKVYPNMDMTASAGKIAENFAASQLKGSPDYDKMSDAQKTQFVSQTTRQILENMSKSLGVVIDPDMPVWKAIYGYMNALLKTLRMNLGEKFTLTWALLLFFVIRGIAIPFVWALIFVGFLFYQLLLALNFGHITGERRTQEVLELS